MSAIGTLYNKPPIYTVDGTVKEKTILEIASQIEAGFESVGDVLGNLHGLGLETVPYSRFVNSVSTSIGTVSDVSPEEPFGVAFDNYVQNFTNNGRDKDFVLDLNPELSSVGIAAPSDPGTVWTRVATLASMTSEGDYYIQGRIVTFYTVPTSAFSITYNGTYPELSGVTNGYMPNVHPSPSLIADGIIDRPTLSARQSGRVLIEVTGESNRNSNGKVFGANLSLEFSPIISQYVSEIGATECPQEYISAWLKTGDTFRKLDTASIYILSNSRFEIDTDEQIDLNLDVIVMAISNVSISDMIRDLYLSHSTHSHDNDSITPSLSHDSLINLIPQSDKTGVVYGGSSIPGNDHPQYLHREGYKPGDGGSYNNALLGDLLISSINPASLFNNNLEDSNRLIFGSTTEGISLKYRAALKDIQLYSAENGLSITYDGVAGKHGLGVNGHTLADINNSMTISSKSGVTRFESNDATQLQDVVLSGIDAESASASSIVIKDNGSITIGGVVLSDTAGDDTVEVSGDLISFSNPVVMDQFSGAYTISDTSSISFGDGSTAIRKIAGSNVAEFFSGAPLSFANTGKNTGFGIDWNDKEYFNLYSATPNGANSTPADHDLYVETGEGDTYFVKSTREEQTDNGEIHIWQQTEAGKTRVDDLRNWPRAPIHAGQGSFKYINIETSSISERRGVSFGDLNHIYVTGSGTECPPGWMVIESQNGVVLVDSRSDAIDCQTMRYSDLTAGNIQAFGSVIAEEDISAGRNIRAINTVYGRELELLEGAIISGGLQVEEATTLSGFTTVRADAQFNANVEIRSGLTVQNTLDVNSLTATGIARFEETARFSNDVYMGTNLTVDRELTVKERLTVEGKINASEVISGTILATEITASEAINANGGLYTQGTLSVNGNANIANALTVESSLIVNDTITANRISTTGDVYIASNINVEGDGTIKGDLTVGSQNGKLSVIGDAALTGETTSISGKLECSGEATFSGDLTVSASSLFKSGVEVEGSFIAKSDIGCSGTISAENVNIAGSAELKTVAVEGLLQAGSIIADGRITIGTTLGVTGRATFEGGIAAPHGTASSLHTLAVTGGLSQADASESVSLAGKVTMASGADISGDLAVGSTTNKTEISGNQITVAGPTGQISASTLSTGRILGQDSNISLPPILIARHSAVASYLSTNKFVSFASAYFDDYVIFSGDAYFSGDIFVDRIKRLDQVPGGIDYVDVISKETYYA
jgi:cytoskeletal protein CcmA (bactofilin family)